MSPRSGHLRPAVHLPRIAVRSPAGPRRPLEVGLPEMTRNRGPHRPARPLLERLEARSLLAGDMVLQWNAVALDAVAADGTGAPADQAGPTRGSRALAIVQAAIFDAVNSIDGSHTPYLIRVKASRGASIEAAAARAAHDT